MYINHKHKFIIPKPFKMAGSSIYTYLKNNFSDNSILIDGHFTYEELINMYNLNPIEYKKVTLIRNPFDYMVSAYFWSWKNGECPPDYTFSDFIHKKSDFNWKKQHKFWNNDSDYYIYFERLPDQVFDFLKIFERVNNINLGTEKKTLHKYYSRYYNQKDKIAVENEFKYILKKHNYGF